MKKILIILMSIFLWASTGRLHASTVEPLESRSLSDTSKTTTLNSDNTYSIVKQQWQKGGLKDDIELNRVIFPSEFWSEGSQGGTFVRDTKGYSAFLSEKQLPSPHEDYVLHMANDQTERVSVSFNVEIPQAGLYIFGFDFYSLTTSIRDIDVAVVVNHETQYYEASQITLKNLWVTEQEVQSDRYGNDIMPNSKQLYGWNHTFMQDASRLQGEPLLFHLKEGSNTIELIRNSGDMLLGNAYIRSQFQYDSYETYLAKHQFGEVEKTGFSRVDAENPSYKNSLAIRYGTDRNITNRPYALLISKLNMVDGATYKKSGDAIYYAFDVEKTGFYYITIKALQGKSNSRVFRTLTVNGEIPFDEARNIPFKSSGWKNHTLASATGDPYAIFLEEGTNMIGLEVNASRFRPIYENIDYVMKEINTLSLDIKKLTGNNVDANREWDIEEYMPNLKSDLLRYAGLLKQSLNEWQEVNQNSKESETSLGLKMAYQTLEQLANKPNDVPKKLSRLSVGNSSVLQRLGTILPQVIESPLSMEAIYLHGSADKLPKAKGGFFANVWAGIQRFFASFFNNQYKDSKDSQELEIWVNRSRQYVNLMQQMADSEFTKETGIKVKISLMPNEDKLILAASSGRQPDIAMGVAGWRPYDFAIRNSVYDLTKFDNFTEVASRFEEGAFMQLVYQDGIYALPETQNFQLLFYRKDIFQNLNLIVPDTWQEVLSILPELQRYGMNFYTPLSGSSAFKGFVNTMPFINQFGGKIYSEDALRATFDDPNTMKAITFMTELYTVYSLPLEVGSFYNQFRYGNIPIGIGDFGMYIQLLHAAPEIAGLWDIAPMPGVLNSENVVDRSYDGAATSAMIFQKSNKVEESWDFLEWWTRQEVQLRYSENLITSMGEEYMWNTSNVKAFQEMSWNESHKQVFLEQWSWVSDTAKTPGSYMLEREISNIWNKVVYNGVNIRTAVEDSLVVTNKEITRKMIEFKFIDQQGNSLKAYRLPTKETIGQWVKQDDKERNS